MNENAGLHVVVGAGGGAGGAIVRELIACGKRVRAVGRSSPAVMPAGVEVVRGDATDPASVKGFTAGAAVVYHAANVPYPEWTERLPQMMEALIAGAGAAGAKLVYVDNLYMYGQVAGPITEDLPATATTRKGALRARLAERLLAAHRAGEVRATIGRASDLYGPGSVNSLAGTQVFPAVVAGKKARWATSLDQAHSHAFVDDVGRVLVTLGERDEALGGIWHAPAAEPLTGRRFIELAFEAADRPARIGVLTKPMVRLGGIFSPTIREFGEMAYQFEAPFVVDGGKYRRAFGGGPTPHREAMRLTVEWFRARSA